MSQQSLSKEYRRNERSFRAFINEARTGYLEIIAIPNRNHTIFKISSE